LFYSENRSENRETTVPGHLSGPLGFSEKTHHPHNMAAPPPNEVFVPRRGVVAEAAEFPEIVEGEADFVGVLLCDWPRQVAADLRAGLLAAGVPEDHVADAAAEAKTAQKRAKRLIERKFILLVDENANNNPVVAVPVGRRRFPIASLEGFALWIVQEGGAMPRGGCVHACWVAYENHPRVFVTDFRISRQMLRHSRDALQAFLEAETWFLAALGRNFSLQEIGFGPHVLALDAPAWA